MDPNDEMKFYVTRWKEVEAIQREEQRQATIEQRMKQFIAIQNLARELGLKVEKNEAEEMEIILKWAKIKDYYAKSSNSNKNINP